MFKRHKGNCFHQVEHATLKFINLVPGNDVKYTNRDILNLLDRSIDFSLPFVYDVFLWGHSVADDFCLGFSEYL